MTKYLHCLSNIINLIFSLKRSLPALRKTVREKLALTHERLQKLGRGIPANKSDRQFRFVEVFCDDFTRLCINLKS